MRVARERRLISAATTGRNGCAPRSATSKRPPTAPRAHRVLDRRRRSPPADACRRAGTAGRRRARARRPRSSAAPGPRGAVERRVGQRARRSATVSSRLPPSTTRISRPPARAPSAASPRSRRPRRAPARRPRCSSPGDARRPPRWRLSRRARPAIRRHDRPEAEHDLARPHRAPPARLRRRRARARERRLRTAVGAGAGFSLVRMQGVLGAHERARQRRPADARDRRPRASRSACSARSASRATRRWHRRSSARSAPGHRRSGSRVAGP